MADLRRIPPGRAGRLWLASRIRAGRLAADLLGRKLAVLHIEQERLRRVAVETQTRWRASWRAADAWMVRATVLSGQRELRLCTPAAAAEVTLSWTQVMGVRYPLVATYEPVEPGAGERGPGSAALIEASAHYRDAAEAAAAHAAADAARIVVDAEIATTRRRLRAVTDRWVPRLEKALRDLTRDLDETERAETFRHARAAGRV